MSPTCLTWMRSLTLHRGASPLPPSIALYYISLLSGNILKKHLVGPLPSHQSFPLSFSSRARRSRFSSTWKKTFTSKKSLLHLLIEVLQVSLSVVPRRLLPSQGGPNARLISLTLWLHAVAPFERVHQNSIIRVFLGVVPRFSVGKDRKTGRVCHFQ